MTSKGVSNCVQNVIFVPSSSQELQELGGLKNIKAELPEWPVSDDTVLHLATAEGLATGEVNGTLNPLLPPVSVCSLLILFKMRS